jgi:flagellar export protein FliJ
MESFHFRLDRVLAWYRNLVSLEEARLAKCYAKLRSVQEAIALLKAERLAAQHAVIRSATVSPQDLAALSAFRLHAILREAGLESERQNRERAMEEQRAILIAIQRRTKLLEKLRERRAAEHHYLEERELEAVAADAHVAKWLQSPR